MSLENNKVCLVITYFGSWPVWFDAFLISCKYNPKINWLIFTDCPIPKDHPENVKFVKFNFNKFSKLATSKIGIPISLRKNQKLAQKLNSSYHKLCDFKITYGCVYEDYLKDYDFWGITDMDIVYGDISNFISDADLLNVDILSSRKGDVSGHFTLFRNTDYINNLFKELEYWEHRLQVNRNQNFDEKIFTKHLKEVDHDIKISWNRWLFNFPEHLILERKYPPSFLHKRDFEGPWIWKDGKIYIDNHEVMYLHFMTWTFIEKLNFKYSDNVTAFELSHNKFSRL
tara:strand:- start:304 stop:1158 length:855 start_codon:yes stop_codon:yes gene_type:complete